MSQNLVDFYLLTPVCEGWQRSSRQHLQRVGKYEGRFIAVCGPTFMKFWDTVGHP